MAIVCSNCEAAPDAGATAGTACAACGERLISVDSADDLIGVTIDGRFQVLSRIGQGGMGVVYRAKQLSIGREVALKVLDRRIEKDVGSVKRFFREAKLASALAHPNTVSVIEFGQNPDGRLYMAMELVKGRTLLAEINAHGAMQLPRIVTIGVQLCDALEAAHEQHLVHRDLKLENVMLLDGKRDHIKILDFGLARSLVDKSTALTQTNMISGTPRYMAPEVGIDAAAPSPPQDMYSVGVMLGELAIGRPLWTTPTIESLFMKKLEVDDSVAQVPAALRPLVRSLISEDPAQRPTAGQTRQLLRDLERAPPRLALELEPVASGPRHARAASPVALEPTAASISSIKVEVVDPFASLDNASAVALDELDDKPPAKPAAPPIVFAPPPTEQQALGQLDDPFTAPESGPPPKLEIDRAYVAERSAKLAARRAEVTVIKKKSGIGKLLAFLLIAGVLGAGGYAGYKYIYKPRMAQGK